MCEHLKMNVEENFQKLIANQRLTENSTIEEDFMQFLKFYKDDRTMFKELQYQLKSMTSKTKSQSQQIQDQRQRRLVQTKRAHRLHRTLQQIYDTIIYGSSTSSPFDQLHHIKKLCEDRLRKEKITSDDEDEIDSHNCTIDEEHNESLVLHPRVVQPQSLARKRRVNEISSRISPTKRFRTSVSVDYSDHTQSSSTMSTSISNHYWQPDSSTISTTKNQSISSAEQILPEPIGSGENLSSTNHRFVSKKIFRPETCFVCLKRIHFGSMSYRCSYCSQSLHVICRKNVNSTCQLSPHATLVDSDSNSPRKQIVSILKITHRQRVIHSEPRKSANHQSSTSSTIQRRLPFERIFLLKK